MVDGRVGTQEELEQTNTTRKKNNKQEIQMGEEKGKKRSQNKNKHKENGTIRITNQAN